MKYQLNNTILRKEYFGGLLANLNERTYHQINEDGFNILKLMTKPVTINKLHQTLSDEYDISFEDLESFINNMDELKVVTRNEGEHFSRIHFDDLAACPVDHLNAPTSVSIYITQFCPKACKHCITRSSPFVDRSTELSTEQWKRAIDKLRDYGCLSIVFTGGDCLSRKDIFEIFRYAESKHFMLAILTDYDGITHDQISEIAKLKNLIDVQVSLDGGSAETHDWMRCEGSFEKSLKRMQKLNDHNIGFTIASAIHKHNFHEIDDIVRIANQYGANHLYLNPLCPYGRGVDMNDDLLTEDQLYALGQTYLRLIRDKHISSGNPFWEENLANFGNPAFNPFGSTFDHVSTGFFNLAINWQGDCYLDSKFSSEKNMCLGNIAKNEIDEIWNNPLLDHVRKKYQETGNVFINKFDLLGGN